jgi:hypothetical protein
LHDIYYFSLTSTAVDLPGLLVTAAPRKADRRRQKDFLAVLLTLTGRHPLDDAGQKNLILKLVEAYYASNKTVTAGIRLAVETLNTFLLERNRSGVREGWNVTGLLNLAIQHEETIYVVNAGPTHSFFLGHHDVYDWGENGGPRGLGLSTQLNLRFYSETLEPGDLLVFSPQPPASWTPTALQGSPALTFDHLRRRLLNQSGQNLQAGVIQFKAGVGEIHSMHLRPVARPVVVESQPEASTSPTVIPGQLLSPPTPEPLPTASSTREGGKTPPASDSQEEIGLPTLEDLLPESQESKAVLAAAASDLKATIGQPEDLFPIDEELLQPVIPAVETPSIPEPEALELPLQTPPEPISTPVRPTPAARRPVRTATAEQQLPLPEADGLDEAPQLQSLQHRRTRRSSAQRQVAEVWLAGRSFRQKVSGAISRLFWRMLPTRTEPKPAFPIGWLWFIAIVVPLLVVAIAMTIFTQLGRGETQQIYLQQARQLATQAMNEPDLAKQRDLWSQTLQVVSKAEEYGENAETRQIRSAVDGGLDELDKVKRIAFNETMRAGLAENVIIIRMVSNGNDIYALDDSSGAILRFVGASGEYEVDQKFICRPQNYNGVIISKLVDVMTLPNGIMANSTVLGVDETGNLIYCGPDMIPTIQTLTPPDQYLGKVAGIAQSGRILLVLDKNRNMIWRYGDPQEDAENQAESLVDWTRVPKPYFQKNVPSLTNIADFVANGEDLYLVDANGQMTTCSYSAINYAPTSCEQPAIFEDPRPGRENKVTGFEGAIFSRLAIDPLNRQSLYVLDQNNSAIYRLSLRLFLDKVIKADSATRLPSGQPSAFVVTTNQYLLLAYGNRLFVARP